MHACTRHVRCLMALLQRTLPFSSGVGTLPAWLLGLGKPSVAASGRDELLAWPCHSTRMRVVQLKDLPRSFHLTHPPLNPEHARWTECPALQKRTRNLGRRAAGCRGEVMC